MKFWFYSFRDFSLAKNSKYFLHVFVHSFTHTLWMAWYCFILHQLLGVILEVWLVFFSSFLQKFVECPSICFIAHLLNCWSPGRTLPPLAAAILGVIFCVFWLFLDPAVMLSNKLFTWTVLTWIILPLLWKSAASIIQYSAFDLINSGSVQLLFQQWCISTGRSSGTSAGDILSLQVLHWWTKQIQTVWSTVPQTPKKPKRTVDCSILTSLARWANAALVTAFSIGLLNIPSLTNKGPLLF